ncbi:MAG: ribonucleoprotein [Bacteroidetes bacterium]|nr:ribonucleoprotein [Bacteroidota bacterium]
MKFNLKMFNKNKTVNYEQAEAYTMDAKTELYAAVVTTTLNDKFYEGADARMNTIRGLMTKVDATYSGKLAVYAREKMYLRSVPLVLAVEMAKLNSGNAVVSKTVNKVVKRADEITELLAYYQLANGRKDLKKLNKLSKQVQKGLAEAFNKFDEYQFSKYNRDAEVKLKDALFLVHPKAKDEAQQALFNKIAKDELATAYTWETEMSAVGQGSFENAEAKATAKKEKWEELIMSGKMGYMAMLRNLRNIIEAEVSDEALQKVCDYIADEKAVAGAKQLPFRYLAAYRELKVMNSGAVARVLTALEKAVLYTAGNIKSFDAKTRIVIACDVSSSMQKAISAKSKILNYDIGLMLAMLLQNRSKNVITGMFGDSWKVINMPQVSVLANVDEFYKREGEVGYSTNGYKVIQELIDRRVKVDKVMMFTDCQMWDSNAVSNMMRQSVSAVWNEYKRIAPDAKLYLFDLGGYGKTPLDIRRKDVYLIAGWSDKIFEVLAAIENGSNAVAEIEKMEL